MDTSIDLVQSASVNLSQLPHTGFDYGEMYNSLFWVVLIVLSIVISSVILKHRYIFTRIFINNGGIPANKTSQNYTRQLTNADTTIIQERVIKQQEETPIKVDKDTEDFVKDIVDKELEVSRDDQAPEDLLSDDFSTVDFDGVNPDDSWQERQIIQPNKVIPQAHGDPIEEKEVIENIGAIHTEPNKPNDKIYQDTLTLDRTGEYPKMVLTRVD